MFLVLSWSKPTGTDLAYYVILALWLHLELQLTWHPEAPKVFLFDKKHIGLDWLTPPLRRLTELYQHILWLPLMWIQSQEEVSWLSWSTTFIEWMGAILEHGIQVT